MARKVIFPLIIAIALVASIGVEAQQGGAIILAKSKSFNFGTIKEEGGVVSFDFEVENPGKSPLIIQRVVSTCNCTSANWDKSPIAPGSKSVIKVMYDPKGRPGQFNQNVTVFSNAETPTLVLQVQGKVQERQKTLEEIYNRPVGDLRFSNIYISFNRVTPKSVKVDTLEFISASNDPIKVGCNLGGLPHLSVKFIPETIKPKEKGLMIVSYDAIKRNDWGFVSDRILLTKNGEVIPNGSITISASIEEDYSKLTEEELQNAPKIEFKKIEYDFDHIEEGKVVEYSFVYKNNGKSNLIIHKIKPSCGCTTVNSDKSVIAPGDSTSFKASFRTNGYNGRVNKSITVISNDPKSSTVVLRIVGVVDTPKK